MLGASPYRQRGKDDHQHRKEEIDRDVNVGEAEQVRARHGEADEEVAPHEGRPRERPRSAAGAGANTALATSLLFEATTSPCLSKSATTAPFGTPRRPKESSHARS